MVTYTCDKNKFGDIVAHALGCDLIVLKSTLINDTTYTIELSDEFPEDQFNHIQQDIDSTFNLIN